MIIAVRTHNKSYIVYMADLSQHLVRLEVPLEVLLVVPDGGGRSNPHSFARVEIGVTAPYIMLSWIAGERPAGQYCVSCLVFHIDIYRPVYCESAPLWSAQFLRGARRIMSTYITLNTFRL